jgi:hypothetical protein
MLQPLIQTFPKAALIAKIAAAIQAAVAEKESAEQFVR